MNDQRHGTGEALERGRNAPRNLLDTPSGSDDYPNHRDVGGITEGQGILWVPHSKEAIVALLRKTAAWGAAAVGAVATVQYGALSEPISGNGP